MFEWCSAGKQSWSTADCRAAAKHYSTSFPMRHGACGSPQQCNAVLQKGASGPPARALGVLEVRNAEPAPLPLPGFPGLAAACP